MKDEKKNSKLKALVLAGGYDQIALIKELKKRDYEVLLADYFENPPAKKEADFFAYDEPSADLCLHEELNLANVHHRAVKRQKIRTSGGRVGL